VLFFSCGHVVYALCCYSCSVFFSFHSNVIVLVTLVFKYVQAQPFVVVFFTLVLFFLNVSLVLPPSCPM
jgi:hypothetical protein